MTIVADRYRYVAGVDTHARTHTLAIIDGSTGRELDTRAFPSTAAAHARVAGWLQRRCSNAANVLIAMEGTNSYGAILRTSLMNHGYRGVEAPGPARSLRRNQGKSDSLDAARAARAVMQLDAERLTEAKTGPASSGNTTRHRLNRSGDRQLNRAMQTITLVRMNHDPQTRAYVQRRTLEGRTKKEIMRSLKQYVTRQVYRTLSAATRC